MHARLLGCSLFLLALLALPTGCGGAQDREPTAPPAQPCSAVPLQPFVVDAEPDTIERLELAMKEGLAAVSYDCNGLRVLEGCAVPGSYRLVAIAPKQVVVAATTEAEAEAKLPGWGANRSARLLPGGSLEVTFVTAGLLVSQVNRVTGRNLLGACNGATHVVRGAAVGAFEASSQNTVGAPNRVRQNKEGEPSTCPRATGPATLPRPQCRGVVQLDLVPITL